LENILKFFDEANEPFGDNIKVQTKICKYRIECARHVSGIIFINTLIVKGGLMEEGPSCGSNSSTALWIAWETERVREIILEENPGR
jgi:hypothetical protein